MPTELFFIQNIVRKSHTTPNFENLYSVYNKDKGSISL